MTPRPPRVVVRPNWTHWSVGACLLVHAFTGSTWAQGSTTDNLLNQAMHWYSLQRPDLARQALNKSLAIDPQQPRVWLWHGLVETRFGELPVARLWLQRLQSSAPGTQETAELTEALRLAGPDRAPLSEIRALARAPQNEATAQRLHSLVQALFPNGPPVGQLRPEYARWMVLASARPTPRLSLAPIAPTTAGRLSHTLGPRRPTAPVDQAARSPDPTPLTSVQAGSATLTAQTLAQRAEQALQAHRRGEALELLTQALAQTPADPWLRYDLARLYDTMGEPQTARELMDTGLAQQASTDMRYAAALLASRQGRDEAALHLMQAIAATERTEGMTQFVTKLALDAQVRQLQALEKSGRYNDLHQALRLMPATTLAQDSVRALDQRLQARRQGQVATAIDVASKSGTPGSSQFRAVEIPLMARIPVGYEGHVLLHADRVNLSAGTIPLNDLRSASEAGQVAAAGPGAVQGPTRQAYAGHLFAAGYETDRWRLDLGHLPTSFPVSGWVGGARWSGEWKGNDVRVDVSRRPVTSSLLSYGGAIDPVTGQAWGGVRRNGINLFLYRALDARSDLIADLTLARLTGQAVPSNRELNLRTSYSSTLAKGTLGRLEAGGAYTFWAFDKNLRYYSYGQGGYYSPQQYQSAVAKLDWTGRHDRWAWQLRGALGYTRSREDDSLYFPGRDDLQAQATGFMATQSLGSPVYTGGPGGGVSYGLQAQIEHTVSDFMQYGLNLQVDRSRNYAPNRLQLYLRMNLDQPAQVTAPPVAVKPYSRY